jgi:hypothetical protein
MSLITFDLRELQLHFSATPVGFNFGMAVEGDGFKEVNFAPTAKELLTLSSILRLLAEYIDHSAYPHYAGEK